jgi:hypothetical protein
MTMRALHARVHNLEHEKFPMAWTLWNIFACAAKGKRALMDLFNYGSGDESPDDAPVAAPAPPIVNAVAVNAAPTVLYNPSTAVTLYGMPAVSVCCGCWPALVPPIAVLHLMR